MPRIDYRATPATAGLQGRLRVPGDKSISHRAVILGALAAGDSAVEGFLDSADVRATIGALRQLGVQIQQEGTSLSLRGVGLHGLEPPPAVLDLGNSGTAARLLAGVLAGQRFDAVIDGDESLRRRPMRRLAEPLTAMNAALSPTSRGTLPMQVTGGRQLHGIDYALPVASAQLKSALLLAGLYARGRTAITEPAPTRDHTERLLEHFGCPVARAGRRLELESGTLRGGRLQVPGDISSAAFFLVAACLVPGSDLLLEQVGLNPTRSAVISILRSMGADIRVTNATDQALEPRGDLRVRYRPLRGVTIPRELVPNAIDEFPALLTAAANAQGETVLTGAAELRVKESDRLQSMAAGLRRLGIGAHTSPDGMRVSGGRLSGGAVDSQGDHRIAMAFSLAGLTATEAVTIRDCKNVDTSFPGFVECAVQVGWPLSARAEGGG